MNIQICKCCGQPVTDTGTASLNNPNVCPECQSADVAGEDAIPAESPSGRPATKVEPGNLDTIAFAT